MANGNGWTKYVVSVIVMVLIAVISFIGKGVVANDQFSRDRDTKIEEKVENVKEELTERLTQAVIKQQNTDHIQTIAITKMESSIMTELRFIKEKL